MEPVRFHSCKEVAELLQVAPQTITRWIAAGRIQAGRIGRDWLISDAEFKRILAELSVGGR